MYSNTFTHLTCLSLLFHVSEAQSSMEPVPTYITHHNWEPSVAITVGAIILALLLMGIISMYVRRCAEPRIIIATQTTVPCSCSQGINSEVLNTFPTLFYASIRELNKGKQTLECAVCLTDFTDKDTLRLLPKCNHVFHPHCIDSWLASHVTCPVCRANLTHDSSHLAITLPTHHDDEGSGNTTEEPHVDPNPNHAVNQDLSFVSDITKSSSFELSSGVELSPNSNSLDETTKIVHAGAELGPESNSGVVVAAPERNLSRSNSTGHSLVEQGKGVERYTLRLPEDVRRYILVNHGRSVQRSASVKGLCWSDSEGSYNAGKRVERWVICTPPFVARHG